MRNIILPGPDKSIDIYHGGLRLTCETADAGDVDFIGIGSIRFNWQPSPIICFELSQVDHLVKDSIMMLIDKSSIFKNKSQLMSLASDFLPEKKIRCDIQVTGINWQDSYVEFKGTPRDRVSVNYPVERACDILKIYLVNLNTYRFQSQEGDLNISLEPLDDFYNLKKLKEEGTKYVVTHCCEVIRGNGQELHAENVELIIQAFGHMFSFIRGGDCFPICFTGYKSKKATPIWGEWMMPHSSPIQEPFDNWSKSQTHFQDMFTNMIAYMRDDFWRDVIVLAIDWYIKANRDDDDNLKEQIIFSQIALDLLTWAYLVEYKKCYSASAFDHDFNASDKIRELLKEMRIGTGMPLGTNDLTSCLRKIDENLKNIDGPQALTTIRNLVVHPKKAKRERLGELSKMALYQALDLGLYYLELILLRLLGYTGAYYNRLYNEYKMVPWGTTPLQ